MRAGFPSGALPPEARSKNSWPTAPKFHPFRCATWSRTTGTGGRAFESNSFLHGPGCGVSVRQRNRSNGSRRQPEQGVKTLRQTFSIVSAKVDNIYTAGSSSKENCKTLILRNHCPLARRKMAVDHTRTLAPKLAKCAAKRL